LDEQSKIVGLGDNPTKTSLPALEHVAMIYKLMTVILLQTANQLEYIACHQSELANMSESHSALSSTACVLSAWTCKKRPSVRHAWRPSCTTANTAGI